MRRRAGSVKGLRRASKRDLGWSGRTALVCAASKGLGKGCAMALAREGVAVTITARGAPALEATADEIRRATGATVRVVAGDIATEEGRRAALDACPDPDILVNNAGGPPPGDFREWDRDAWIKALDANMLTPIFLIRATVDRMMARGFGRIVNITSAAVKAPLLELGLSNGARTGLTGFVAGLSRQVARKGVTINSLLPGMFDTDRLRGNLGARARASGRSIEEEMQHRTATVPAGRIGDPAEFGAVCAFLCSVHAGYMTGQNILLDGGAFPGTL
jgi:3-oxoacyl-[acyl-carrier protein] reductase